jgi:acetolactate synthase-1/2/3 large subunit
MTRAINLVADILKEAGINHVFGLPGGYTQFLMGAVHKKGIKTVTARHEASAAVMADVYGRITGNPGVLLGQGVWVGSNGAFGIMEAFFAGSPMVIITDISDWDNMSMKGTYQCGSGDYGNVNLQNIFQSMTKYMTYATTPKDFVYGVQLAIKHATSGRPGPTCVLTNKNSIGGKIEDPEELDPPIYSIKGHLNVDPPSVTESDANEIADILIGSKNPLLICGRGVHVSRAYNEVQELVEILGMPVATSYMGKSSIPETHDLALGVMGGRGQKLATEMIGKADTVLAVGSALAPENTNNCSKDFINVKEQKLIQIDIDPRNVGWTYPVDIGVTSDAKLGLRKIIDSVKEKSPQIDTQGRIENIKKIKQDPENEHFTSKYYVSDEEPINPERVVKEINDLIRKDDLLLLDAGNNRIWFCSLFKSKRAGQVIAPGGAAGMAWSPNAAIGAQMLNKDKKVISVVGDGGMLMSLYALETVKAYDLPVLFILLNNSSLGNVRDFFGRKTRELAEYPETNFAELANTMGIRGLRVEKIDTLRSSIKKGLESDEPTLLEIMVKRASHLRVRSSL